MVSVLQSCARLHVHPPTHRAASMKPERLSRMDVPGRSTPLPEAPTARDALNASSAAPPSSAALATNVLW
jgi:hypothetical protein